MYQCARCQQVVPEITFDMCPECAAELLGEFHELIAAHNGDAVAAYREAMEGIGVDDFETSITLQMLPTTVFLTTVLTAAGMDDATASAVMSVAVLDCIEAGVTNVAQISNILVAKVNSMLGGEE